MKEVKDYSCFTRPAIYKTSLAFSKYGKKERTDQQKGKGEGKKVAGFSLFLRSPIWITSDSNSFPGKHYSWKNTTHPTPKDLQKKETYLKYHILGKLGCFKTQQLFLRTEFSNSFIPKNVLRNCFASGTDLDADIQCEQNKPDLGPHEADSCVCVVWWWWYVCVLWCGVMVMVVVVVCWSETITSKQTHK